MSPLSGRVRSDGLLQHCHSLLTLGIFITGSCLVSTVSLGAEDVPVDKDEKPVQQTQAEVTVTTPRLVSTFLEMPVVLPADKDGNQQMLGMVSDLLIDQRTAHVPFALVRPVGDQAETLLVLPLAWGMLKNEGVKEITVWTIDAKQGDKVKQLEVTPDALPVPASRIDEWNRTLQISKKESELDKQTHENSQEALTSLRGLYWQKIVTPDGQQIATVTDFVVDRKKQHVAYALVSPGETSPESDPPENGEEIAIPLAAFVQHQAERTWLLELPPEQLKEHETVNREELPSTVPRSWIEYVSVRYGSDVTLGVQPAPEGEHVRKTQQKPQK